jgi:hypothetical protein
VPVSVIVLTPPTAEPLSLAEARKFCRVDYTDEDDLISGFITDARIFAEQLTKRALAPQTIQAIIEPPMIPAGQLSGPVIGPTDAWMAAERPDIPLFGNMAMRMKLPMSPVSSMTTVEYQLTRMDQPEWQTLPATDQYGNPNYRLDTYASPTELNIFTIIAASRYRLTYQAGYTTLPRELRTPLLKLVSFYFNNRDGEPVPDSLRDQIMIKRVFEL